MTVISTFIIVFAATTFLSGWLYMTIGGAMGAFYINYWQMTGLSAIVGLILIPIALIVNELLS